MSQAAESRERSSPLKDTIYKQLSKMEAIQEANRCLYCYDAPCTKACPTHIDVPSFIRKISTENLLGSARVIMEANPIGASCARVCPTEQLCEGACVLGKDTSPIRIGDLQRYATDFIREQEIDLFKPGTPTGRTVAIIGGGPAGLAAARELARMGHGVTIYEAKEQLGGLDTYGIVPFRLPMDVALWEAEQVIKLGVQVRTGVYVGKDVSIQEIVHKFDAVVLAFGMGSVPRLNISGEDLEGVWDAIEFIERVKCGLSVGDIGNRVAVIGAGNTAIDAATCSKRLGVEHVTMYYRRTRQEMSAYEFEYDFAKQEGVEFRWLCIPLRIIGEQGRVSAIEFIRASLDNSKDSGWQKPIPVPGTKFIVPVDTVIRAIGQTRLTDLSETLELSANSGVIQVDEGCRTTHPKVFAAGDCTFERGVSEAMVVEAAQQGKIAAMSVHRFLSEARPEVGD